MLCTFQLLGTPKYLPSLIYYCFVIEVIHVRIRKELRCSKPAQPNYVIFRDLFENNF